MIMNSDFFYSLEYSSLRYCQYQYLEWQLTLLLLYPFQILSKNRLRYML